MEKLLILLRSLQKEMPCELQVASKCLLHQFKERELSWVVMNHATVGQVRNIKSATENEIRNWFSCTASRCMLSSCCIILYLNISLAIASRAVSSHACSAT